MLLFRLILLVAIVFIAWRIYRLVMAPRVGAPREPTKIAGEDMVECAFCAVHVPRGNAIAAGAHWYCCEEHRRKHDDAEAQG